ncbi:hypothetical protein PsorP6_012299 [Peronosclerospora sorghi]|uniref:Uncharacterized protein n=1 Tax=Peronosclerospora sorghi TaxID=230839 RepID=A0ACC0WH00_9STRA|nr:hypothetical protein PsorP6_012299 [Peronosclerospora sorghi]
MLREKLDKKDLTEVVVIGGNHTTASFLYRMDWGYRFAKIFLDEADRMSRLEYCGQIKIQRSWCFFILRPSFVMQDVEMRSRGVLPSPTSDSPSEPEAIAVGAKTSILWTDIGQRPLFQLVVEGCTMPPKWLELAPRGTARGAVLSVQISRVDDGRQFRLLLRIVGDTDNTATPVYVEFLSDIWVINRSGLELVYGTAADSEAYIPPPATRTRVGNAQISA